MGKKNRRPPAAEPPEDAPLDEPAASEPDASDRVMTQFARNLATGNRKTRAQALGALEKWLQGRGEGASELELRKLWRGIFFCVWMVDKAPVQLEVSRTIARLVHCFEAPAHAARWLRCWGSTLRGEWGKLDKHRIDKYYTLIRQVVVEAVNYARARAWAADACGALVGALDAELVRQLPNGPRLHLADVLLEALGVAGADGADEADEDGEDDGGGGAEPGPSAAVLALWLEPFVAQLARTGDAPVVRRVLERLVHPLLAQCRRGREDPAAAAAWHGELLAWLAARVFAIAAAPATPDANREALYATVKQCQKMGCDVSAAGPSGAAPAPAKTAPAKPAGKAKRSLVEDEEEPPASERPRKTKKGAAQKRRRK